MKQFDPIFFTPPSGDTKRPRTLYKGGSAPKPDPQIGRAALETAQIGRDAFEFYKQEYENNKPQQQKMNEVAAQVQEQLLASSRLSDSYAKDYQDYMINTFRPLEKSIVNDATSYDTAGRREQEAAKGLSDVRQAFDTQRQISQRNSERAGINPNSGNAQALNAQMDVQEAIAGASAVNKGRANAENTARALKMDAASLGRNLPINQMASQQAANSAATGGLNAGLAAAQNQRAGLAVMGQGFNAASSGVQASGNMLNQQYNNQLQAWQANQQANDSAWGNIGSVVGMGASIFASDENIKKNINDFDEDEALEGIENTDVKSWEYDEEKAEGLDSKRHIGAMAQELNKNFGDVVSDGKKVDIISAIGLNMAATKALSKKLDDVIANKVHESEGVVKGQASGTGDTVAAKLRPNEFVLNEEATEKVGLSTLNKLNKQGLKARKAK